MRRIGFKDYILIVADNTTTDFLSKAKVLAENFDAVVESDKCYILIPRNITEVKIDLKKYLDEIDWIE